MIGNLIQTIFRNVHRDVFAGFDPAGLDLIAWYDLQDPTLMTVERNGTGGEPGDGDVVGRITDKSGNGVYWTAVSDAARPILRLDGSGYYLDFDDVDDSMSWTITDSGQIGMATRNGTYVADVTYAGAFAMPVYQPFDYTDVIIADSISASDFEAYAVARGAVGSFGAETSVRRAWRNRTDLTSFPLIDTSLCDNFNEAWFNCTGLLSFPLIDTSLETSFSSCWRLCTSLTSFPLIDTSNATAITTAWRDCSGLTSFPLIDTSSCTSLADAWYGCSSLTAFPAIVTSSVTSFSQSWRGCSSLTTFPAINVSAGTSFSGTWRDCTSLTTFPANMFDSVTATDFANAFASTNLDAASIDAILVSINTANTSSGNFKQSLGTAPSATGEAAIDSLRARSWTVTVTGGY